MYKVKDLINWNICVTAGNQQQVSALLEPQQRTLYRCCWVVNVWWWEPGEIYTVSACECEVKILRRVAAETSSILH